MLERDAPYVQIIERYRQEIRAGRLKDGDMLPSGREIAAPFGVSLATAAKVATGPQALGLVAPGPGWDDRHRVPATCRSGAGWAAHHHLATRSPARPGDTARVLDAEMVPAPQTVASQLGVDPMTPVICRRQVTARNGATTAMLTSWFPAALGETVPGLLRKARLIDEVSGYSPLGVRIRSHPGHLRRRKPVSSASNAARPSWWCTAAASPPTTPCLITPSSSPAPTPGLNTATPTTLRSPFRL
jgi:hypothetical protein